MRVQWLGRNVLPADVARSLQKKHRRLPVSNFSAGLMKHKQAFTIGLNPSRGEPSPWTVRAVPTARSYPANTKAVYEPSAEPGLSPCQFSRGLPTFQLDTSTCGIC